MAPSIFHLFLLLLLLLHFFPSSSLPPSELAALADIRRSLRDLPGSRFFATWNFNSNSDPCISFSGIICNEYSSVSVLTLGTGLADSPGLTGTLPTSLGNLVSLNELIINPGQISGPIPYSLFSQCRNLRLVSISNNLVSGSIPESLIGLSELHTLDLGHNRLSGSIPSQLLPSLPELKVLILSRNGLTGQIPTSLSSTQLLHLDISQNSLDGPLPPLPSTLRYLSATGNMLAGSLAAAFASPLPELAFLDLSKNRFLWRVPAEIFASPVLETILLHRNNFSGLLSVPVRKEWTLVDISHNSICGELPAALSSASSLLVNSNRLRGPVPEEYAARIYDGTLSTFYAQHNFLTGFPVSKSLPTPEGVSVCLAYNCMDFPLSIRGECPVEEGMAMARPPEQCP